ncbi:MAG: sugar phosphate isomerase/epimerase family protein [Planctomycetota bacterium]
MTPDRSRLSIHTMTTKPWSLEECCREYASAGVPAITVWRQAIEPLGTARAAQVLKASGLRVTALCRGGFFPALDAVGRQKALDDNRKALDDAAAIGAPLVVLVCGAVPGLPLSEARKQIADGIAAVLPHARALGVKLSIEPLHPQYAADRSAVSTMAQARRICETVNTAGRTDVGIAVDVYHVWWDDALEDEIARAGKQKLIHAFHVCDWKTQQSDVLNDRGLMGEGCIDIPTIRGWVERAGFNGDIEVEIFSNRWWATDQRAYLQQIIAAYQTKV